MILDFGSGFLDMASKAQAIKRKKNGNQLQKIKNFCVSKDNIKEVKIQPIEWKKLQIINLVSV